MVRVARRSLARAIKLTCAPLRRLEHRDERLTRTVVPKAENGQVGDKFSILSAHNYRENWGQVSQKSEDMVAGPPRR